MHVSLIYLFNALPPPPFSLRPATLFVFILWLWQMSNHSCTFCSLDLIFNYEISDLICPLLAPPAALIVVAINCCSFAAV